MEADIRPSDLDSAFSTICANDDVEFPPGEAECPDPKQTLVALEKFWQDLQKELPSKIDPATTCLIQKAARDFQGQMRVSRYRMERPAVMAALLGIWDCESKIVQKSWADSPSEKTRLRDLIQGLHARFHAEVVMPYLAQWRQYVYRLSVTLLTRAREYATAERRRMNSLNYGDLLNLTSRVLRENEVVRRALQRKFRHLLVDEFQDTDPVQAEILFWLAQDGDQSSSSAQGDVPDWRKLSLRPGSLFIVGDPKQSIYRFRRADIDIYNLVRKRFSDPAIGRVVPLTLNFRSVPQLCDWANATFQARFPAEPTAYAPRFAPLDANRSDSLSGGVFTMSHNCDSQMQGERAHQEQIFAIGLLASSPSWIAAKIRIRCADDETAAMVLRAPPRVTGLVSFYTSRLLDKTWVPGLTAAASLGELCGRDDGLSLPFPPTGTTQREPV